MKAQGGLISGATQLRSSAEFDIEEGGAKKSTQVSSMQDKLRQIFANQNSQGLSAREIK